MKVSLALCKRMVEVKFELGLNKDEMAYLMYLIDDLLPIHLHETLFVPFIRSQGTEDQAAEWADKAERDEIIGCYAQTELGHGSNLAALETVAVFRPENDEFEINSPTLTATKFWIGGLGVLATHTILMAKLVIGDKDYGVHPFIVQVRDLQTHRAMPGITVGDLGPKMGVNGMDNGFLRFDQVRIPRTNLLMRHCHLTRDGTYTPPVHPKIFYGGMTMLRTFFLNYSSLALARAVTIATRFCTGRRQFGSDEGETETQVIHYPSVQYRIFPALALNYGLAFTGYFLGQSFNKLNTLSADPKANPLKLAKALSSHHALSSSLKIIATTQTAQSLETLRMTCGGLGYAAYSGFGEMYNSFVHTCSAEGENHVLMLQVARWAVGLVQHARKSGKSDLNSNEKFVLSGLSQQQQKINLVDPRGAETQVKLFEVRCAKMFVHLEAEVSRLTQVLMGEGKSKKEASELAFRTLQVPIIRACEAHGEYVILRSFWRVVEGPLPRLKDTETQSYSKDSAVRVLKYPMKDQKDQGSYKAVRSLASRLGLYLMEKHALEFIELGLMEQPRDLNLVREHLYGSQSVLKQIQPDAVALVDSLSVPDYVTNSALGNGDGRIYDRIWDWALLGGYHSVASAQPTPPISDPLSVLPKASVNRVYNRELFTDSPAIKEILRHRTQGQRAAAKSGQRSWAEDGDPDKENERDREETNAMRDWQEVHALIIRPLVSGQVARKKLNKNKL